MKSVVVISCVLLIGCGQKSGNEAADAKAGFGEADIKSSWVELTYNEGKWVIMNWCAVENLHLDWQQDTLAIEWGQDPSTVTEGRLGSTAKSRFKPTKSTAPTRYSSRSASIANWYL